MDYYIKLFLKHTQITNIYVPEANFVTRNPENYNIFL